jgi:two-component system chemotaxis response regulator CheB
MDSTRLIVVGAGAGGILAMRRILSGLPDEFDSPIVLLAHSAPEDPDPLPQLVQRQGRFEVIPAVDGTLIQRRTAYLVPRGCHAQIGSGGVLEVSAPKRLRTSRPAVDRLFETAAAVYGARCIAVVLTGHGDDGTNGMRAISAVRGVSFVQSAADSEMPGMPISALIGDNPNQCLLLQEIAPALVRAVGRPVR